MKIEEAPGRLVIRDNPVLFWGFASLFLFSGAATLYLAWFKTADPMTRTVVSVIGFAHLGGACFLFWKEPASVVEIDLLAGSASIRRRGLFGRSMEKILLSDVVRAEVEVGEHTEGGPIYRPILVRHTGRPAPVSLFWYQQRSPSEKVAERINGLLGRLGR